MFEEVARSICIEAEDITGTNAAATASILTKFDHARALFSALPHPNASESAAWVPGERFLDVPIPVHLVETIQPPSGSRFFAVRKTESEEQPQETEDQELEAEPLDATGAAAAAAEPLRPPPLEPEPLSPEEDPVLQASLDATGAAAAALPPPPPPPPPQPEQQLEAKPLDATGAAVAAAAGSSSNWRLSHFQTTLAKSIAADKQTVPYQQLDQALCKWLQPVNWQDRGFEWHNPGTGGQWPKKSYITFPGDKVQYAARTDFFRGRNSDDPGNGNWNFIMDQLPGLLNLKYGAPGSEKENSYIVLRSYNDNARANFFEACLGSCFAVWTGNAFMEGSYVKGRPEEAEHDMREVWRAFMACGFGPVVPMAQALEQQPRHSLSAPIVMPLSDSQPGCHGEPEDEPNPVLALLLDPDWRPSPHSELISHWTCGRMPVELNRDRRDAWGEPRWIERSNGHASGYKIFIGDLPPDITVAEFRAKWLVNNSTVHQALTVPNTDSNKKRPVLYDINFGRAPSGDTMAFLTFDRLSEAEACMEVFVKWWRPCRDRVQGQWKPRLLKVRWMQTA